MVGGTEYWNIEDIHKIEYQKINNHPWCGWGHRVVKSDSHRSVWTQNVVIFVLNRSNFLKIIIKILSWETNIYIIKIIEIWDSKLLPCTFLMWQSFPHFEHTRCKYWIIIVAYTIFTLFVYSFIMITTINIIVTCPQRLLWLLPRYPQVFWLCSIRQRLSSTTSPSPDFSKD